MSKHSEVEMKLRANVLDDPKYSKKQIIIAEIGLVIGLWGPFVTATIILFLMTRGIIGLGVDSLGFGG